MTTYSSNREEIIELAQLEVLGALENADCVRLERLFRDSSPLIQREIIDIQAELARQSALLPMIEPENSLRLRVLATVAQAVEASDSELAPLAAIGRPLARSSGGHMGNISSESDQLIPVRIAEDAHWRRSALLWRAACIAAIGGLVAAVAFDVVTARQATRISELALQNSVSTELHELLGSDFRKFRDQRCIVRGLVGSTIRDNGSATVYLAPTLDAAFITWLDLSPGQKLILQSIDRDSGLVRDAGAFAIVNPIGGTRLEVPLGVANAVSDWQIVDARGAVVFTTRPN